MRRLRQPPAARGRPALANRSGERMQPFRTHKGKVVPLDRANVDTDQIIPKQFLKRIERTGFGEFLFLRLAPRQGRSRTRRLL